MENDKLVKASQSLTEQASQLKVIGKLIELLEYSRVSGDKLVVNHFLNTNTLDSINENISNIQEVISQVSDSIYPKREENEDEEK